MREGFSRYAAASWSQAADFDIPAERGLTGGPACLRPGRKERQPQPFSRQLKTVYTVLLMCKIRCTAPRHSSEME
jgi:hypothetical protein